MNEQIAPAETEIIPGRTGVIPRPQAKSGPRPKPITWKENDHGCWECVSHAPDTHGYPQVGILGLQMKVCRHVWQSAHGEVPAGLVIRHKCDNRLCVRLSHLLIGTVEDNVQDAVERKRHSRGEQHHTAVITAEQAKEIWLSPDQSATLARRMSVSHSIVHEVRSGHTWKDVTNNLPPQPIRRKARTFAPLEWTETSSGCHRCSSHAPSVRGRIKLMVDGEITTAPSHVYSREIGGVPEGYEALCRYGELTCIRADHLELVPLPGRAKLTEGQVREVLALRGHKSSREVANQYGVWPKAILDIWRGESWVHISRDGDWSGPRPIPRRIPRGSDVALAKLTDDDVRAIRQSTGKGRDLARHYGVSPSVISNVRNRKTWAHVPDETGAANGAVND